MLQSSLRTCRRVAFAAIAALALAYDAPAQARPRCELGQIYRPSMGICQSKTSASARPYVKKAVAAPKAVARDRVIVREIVREKDPEPLSTIPLPVPAEQGSLNPLPRWNSRLQFDLRGFPAPEP